MAHNTNHDLTRADFAMEAALLAMEIADVVLKPKAPIRTTVVMEALMRLYDYHSRQLPPDAQKDCARALGLLALEQLQATATSHPNAPTGAPTH